ncbi:MATE family efflux transporter [Psychrobacter sp. I-STPA10]|uniref:MATE family efflux transporter n=1 Tax=Psychrobacter sp. I-STPA10 TaxID=2585769 RepID=UPI001E6297E3|nr:MATE family efflux transporter [Psychrobacter sp. I-STPA10]
MANSLSTESTESSINSPIDLSYTHIIKLAVPVLLANLAMPIQSGIDIAVVGHFNQASSLAGLGLATQLLALILVSLNFLQYASSGLSAQAVGSNQTAEQKTHALLAILQRSLVLAVILGAMIFLSQPVLIDLGLNLLGSANANKAAASSYLNTRLFGVAFELMNYAFLGWFAGQGKTTYMLYQQICIAVLNIIFTLILVYVFDLGLQGVALGTVFAYALGMLMGFVLVSRHLSLPFNRIFQLDKNEFSYQKMLRLFSLNKDIFIRTLVLTLSFTWITRLSALQGDVVLATNAILLQVLSMSAFALDGVAVAAESLSGQAAGKNQLSLLKQAIRRTGIVIFILAALLSGIWYLIIPLFLTMMTNIENVLQLARQYTVFAALLPLVGAGAYWLDGVLFGLTAGKTIRQVALGVAVLFFPVSWGLYTYLPISDLFVVSTQVHAAMWAIWLSIYWLLIARFILLAVILSRKNAQLLHNVHKH